MYIVYLALRFPDQQVAGSAVRGLNPKNVLISRKYPFTLIKNSTIILSDFSNAFILKHFFDAKFGIPICDKDFVAPELRYSGYYRDSSDIWACGK